MDLRNPDRKIVAIVAAIVIVAGAIGFFTLRPASGPAVQAESGAHPGDLTADQIARLNIRLEAARAAGALPLGTVPATVTLPPEARVAVTTPFTGTAVQVLVIQGQEVARGQALAIVRAPETVRVGAELARAEADLAFARSNALRLEQLNKEGIVAGVRADEARAAASRTEATIRESHRLLALAGAGSDGTITLRAPIAGRVASVAVDAGGPVGEGTAPFIVENVAALTLDLQLPVRLAGQVHPGMAVEVALPGGLVAGRVLSVGAGIDPVSNSLLAKASIPAAPGLVPGKGVMAIISADSPAAKSASKGAPNGASASSVAVPSSAIVRIGGQDFVFVGTRTANGVRFDRRPVTVAATAGERTVLSAGLKPGAAVATSGVAELKSLLAE